MWTSADNRSVVLVVVLLVACPANLAGGQTITAGPFVSAASILRAKGYRASVHHVVTEDGYILELVRGSNPLVNAGTEGGLPGKDAILFTHGIFADARNFINNNLGARPRDYSRHNASAMSEQELNELLASDPSAKSLAFLALNFGHDVWLLSRRGTPISQGHIAKENWSYPPNPSVDLANATFGGLPPPELVDDETLRKQMELESRLPSNSCLAEFFVRSLGLASTINQVNPRYWNYSLDDVARYDLPNTVEFILNKTNRSRVSLVGHSAGSAATLMALTMRPELADNLSKILLWAPALDLGGIENFSSQARLGLALEPFLKSFIGPIPPTLVDAVIQPALEAFCATQVNRDSFCIPLFDTFFGPSGGEQDLNLPKAFPLTTGSHELLSFLQSIQKGRMHFFDYRDAERNMIAYGQPEPPVYDISRITSRSISLWHGITDTIVPPFAVDRIKQDLAVPVEVKFINESAFFNHIGFFEHKNVARLLNIPSLRTIESTA